MMTVREDRESRSALLAAGRWPVASLCLALLLALGARGAAAASPIGVATFDTSRPEAPGTTVERTVRLSNLAEREVTLHLEPRAVEVRDEGATRFGDAEDLRWAGRVTVAEPDVTLAPKAHRDVAVRIAIPADAPPDEYLLGLLARPLTSGAGIQIVAEMGMLLPITVQGDRQRSLALAAHQLPRLVIGDHVTGTVRVTNTGTTFAAGWLEADVSNALTGSRVKNIQVRDNSRVAPGLSRTFTYTWHAGVTAGKFIVPVRVSYNRDDATVADLTVQEEVWLVHPYVLDGVGVLLAAGLLAALTWTVRRRSVVAVTAAAPLA